MRNHQKVSMVFVACGLILFSAPVLAESDHFVVEPFSGVNLHHGSSDDGVGLESGVLFGVGGKFKGFSPRFFLYFRSSYSFFGGETVMYNDNSTSTLHRNYTRLTGGLRVIIPLYAGLRMNLELGGGKIFAFNQDDSSDGVDGSYGESMGIVEFGVGLNYRVLHWLTAGVITNYAVVVDSGHNDKYGLYYSTSNPNWMSITATLGFHF